MTIDRDFARFGSKSFAINKINTVDVREKKLRGKGAAIAVGVVAAVLLLAAYSGQGEGFGVFGAIAAIVAVLMYRRRDIYEYGLILVSSSSEEQLLTTRDRDEIDTLRAAVEKAMVGRGRQ
ncbi:DUF6232 family protein [Sphingomonas sp. ID0503]|uniref:DUF6232 family protein n=1 Tax=Sphingomonas sp. ID0503 TaxID=3399691 RepID=UPI003AFA41C3